MKFPVKIYPNSSGMPRKYPSIPIGESAILLPMKTILLLTYLLTLGVRFVLRTLDLRHLRRYGHTVPEGFEDAVDPQRLARSADYTLAKSRLGRVESLVSSVLALVFLFAGGLSVYDRFVQSLGLSFVLSGVVFFVGIQLALQVLDIPFSLIRTFHLEKRFGFNRSTGALWLADLAKSTLLASVLMAAVVAGALALVQHSPRFWWLWVWAFFALVTLFLLYLSPYVIEPLFFKFSPVARPELAAAIEALMARTGLRVSAVQQVDASKRSGHSNAYFTGIGRVKRIVLFDTLLAQMTDREILAVLAHEVGHWKKGHIRNRLLTAEIISLLGCVTAYGMLTLGVLPAWLGLDGSSFHAQVVILVFVFSLAGFFFQPLSNALSRRHEWQADHFAAQLTEDPEALATALVKLSRENLANLHPHPLYAWFSYSHPPVVARVARLRGYGQEPVKGEGAGSRINNA